MTADGQQAELLLRGAASGIFVALALGLLRGRRSPARLTGALFCLGAMGHTLTQSPTLGAALGPGAAVVWVMSVVAGGLFWAFALDLFTDSRNLQANRFVPAALLLLIALGAVSAPKDVARYLWLAQNLVNAALMVHVLAVIWRGLADDLVEPRRRLRGPMIGAAAVYALAISAVQSTELFSRPASQLSGLAALLLLALALAGSLVFLRTDDRLFGRADRPNGASMPENVAAQDSPTLERLRKALDEDQAWRREDLTIGRLAQEVGVPEHRLRKIINEGMGYRNFAAFLNERRVGAAKAALGDRNDARRPISNIAFDVGFNSLASFNRVFREMAGLTPTAFRAEALRSSSLKNDPQN